MYDLLDIPYITASILFKPDYYYTQQAAVTVHV